MQVGLIGSGNMARGMARGWGRPILCTDVLAERAELLAAEVGGEAVATNVELAQRADLVVTMGCGDTCPYIPGKRYLDWDLPDPKGRPVDEVRATRDDIEQRVAALLDDLGR